jgi:Tol biopolymer transport system component
MDPTVVGDGEPWVVYQWISGSGDGIFLVRPDGSGRHELLPDLPGSEIQPDWSPDGQRIAFVRFTPEDRSELWVVDADGSDATKLTSCDLPCNSFGFPDWSADGGAIYHGMDSNARDGQPPTTFGIGKYDFASGTDTTVLSREDGLTVEMPRVSPDGAQVAFTRSEILDESNGWAVFVADLATGTERRLTEWDLFAAHPDWGADGRILFHSRDDQQSEAPGDLYTIAADGTDPRRLTTMPDETWAFQPRWTADGTAIVFTRQDGKDRSQRRLATVDADGSNERWLVDPPIQGTHPQSRPLPGG